MSPECKAVLTEMAKAEGLGISECYYQRVRQSIHAQARVCNFMEDLLDKNKIRLDGGVEKPCFGHLCCYCDHRIACRARVYSGVVHMKDEFLGCAKPGQAAYIRELQEEAGQTCQDFKQVCNKNSGTAIYAETE